MDLVRLVDPARRLLEMPRLQRGARAEALDHDGGVVHTTTQLNHDPFHRCLAQGEHRELRRTANADVQTLGRQRVVLDARAGQVEPDQGQEAEISHHLCPPLFGKLVESARRQRGVPADECGLRVL